VKRLTKLSKAWLIFPLLFAAENVHAHPVAYQGAFALMTWNQPFLSDFWAAYSFRPDMAVAARVMRMNMDQGGESISYLGQFDYLVKRWNKDHFQANIYTYAGFGGVHFQNQNGVTGLVGIEADVESRRLFILGRYEGMASTLGAPFFHKGELRLGIAPYEAEIDELASWFMIQFQVHPSLSRPYAITPMVRFFYKSVLWETGISLQGDWMLNLMFHF
jgi:hypothetical protein